MYGGALSKEGVQPTLADLGEIKEEVATLELRKTTLAEERSGTEAALTEALQTARLVSAALAQESGRRHGLEARVGQLEQSLANQARNVELSTEESARALADASLTKESIREHRERPRRSRSPRRRGSSVRGRTPQRASPPLARSCRASVPPSRARVSACAASSRS